MKKRHDTYQYITPVRRRWRTQVTQEHVGMYDDPRTAAMMADAYILGELETEGLTHIGRWEFNFPDMIPNLTERTLLWLHFNGDMHPWIENGSGDGPQLSDYIKRPETDDEDALVDYFERLYLGQQIGFGYRVMNMMFPDGVQEFVQRARDFEWKEDWSVSD
jgi:hypothetical protein